MRDCGECNACCKLPGLPEMGKGTWEWCSHCRIGGTEGCGIYDSRPSACSSFNCAWRADDTLAEHMRPDKCRMMVTVEEVHGIQTIIFWPLIPGALAKKDNAELIKTMAEEKVAVVIREPAAGGGHADRAVFARRAGSLVR